MACRIVEGSSILTFETIDDDDNENDDDSDGEDGKMAPMHTCRKQRDTPFFFCSISFRLHDCFSS